MIGLNLIRHLFQNKDDILIPGPTVAEQVLIYIV